MWSDSSGSSRGERCCRALPQCACAARRASWGHIQNFGMARLVWKRGEARRAHRLYSPCHQALVQHGASKLRRRINMRSGMAIP
eukprot:365124-Chlamydomonas_euryale.AAC.10